jgi:hypothetical protein
MAQHYKIEQWKMKNGIENNETIKWILKYTSEIKVVMWSK